MVELSLVEDMALNKDIIELLSKYKGLWSGHLGTIKSIHHTIGLKDGTRPVRQQPYRTEKTRRELLYESIVKQLEVDVVKLAQSEWGSSNVLVLGIFSFCLAYWQLNVATIPYTYPLSRFNNCIDILG